MNRRGTLSAIGSLLVAALFSVSCLVSGSSLVAAPASPQTVASVPDVDPREAVGSKSAPVVMEVFSDFQCPACKSLYESTNRQLMDSYVNTGKVYLIHRDFPLPMHSHSKEAAQYSRAAAQIGKLEAVEDVLIDSGNNVVNGGNRASVGRVHRQALVQDRIGDVVARFHDPGQGMALAFLEPCLVANPIHDRPFGFKIADLLPDGGLWVEER